MRAPRTPMPIRGLTALISAAGLTVGCAAQASASRASAAAPLRPSARSAEAAAPFGPTCPKVPTTGPGSFGDMARSPVATAASRTPLLSTFATAIRNAGLAATLNRAPALTVFAPTLEAFAKLPPATVDRLLADKPRLARIVRYHVVAGRHTPAELASGTFRTLEGGAVTTAKKPDGYTVNGASVVCGDVTTRNATVYMIDTLLLPRG